jgi:hypothetical protein
VIGTLRVGMRVILPSGNVIVLLRRERMHWVCEYTDHAHARGEVEFSGVWLRQFGRALQSAKL